MPGVGQVGTEPSTGGAFPALSLVVALMGWNGLWGMSSKVQKK